jgi:hypothetical protein
VVVAASPPRHLLDPGSAQGNPHQDAGGVATILESDLDGRPAAHRPRPAGCDNIAGRDRSRAIWGQRRREAQKGTPEECAPTTIAAVRRRRPAHDRRRVRTGSGPGGESAAELGTSVFGSDEVLMAVLGSQLQRPEGVTEN